MSEDDESFANDHRLVLARVPFRKTHDLEALRDLVVPRFPELMEALNRLVPLTD